MKTKFEDLLENVKDQNKKHQNKQDKLAEMESLVGASDAVQEAIVGSIGVLIEYMEQATTKTEITNHPDPVTSVKTPDVKEVVTALSKLESVLASQSQFSDKATVEALGEIKSVLNTLPKSFPELPKPLKAVKVTNLEDAVKAVRQLEKAVKAQKLDPKIDVKPADVKIDLKPLEKKLDVLAKKDVSVKVPKQKDIDLKPLEKAIKAVDKSINSLSFPVPTFKSQPIVDAVEAAAGLVPTAHDHIALTYVASGNGEGEIETVTYKTGGSGGTTVATLTLGYDSSNRLNAVTKS